MERYEMILMVVLMYIGSEFGGAIGCIGFVAAYVILSEIISFGLRKLILNYVRKEG